MSCIVLPMSCITPLTGESWGNSFLAAVFAIMSLREHRCPSVSGSKLAACLRLYVVLYMTPCASKLATAHIVSSYWPATNKQRN